MIAKSFPICPLKLKNPYIYSCIVILLWMPVTPLPAEELSQETKATLQMLIDANADMNDHMSGKVIALVNISQAEGFQKIIECMFKDKWARVDIYSVENGQKDQREFVLAYGPSGSIQFDQSKSYASIDQNDSSWEPFSWVRKQSMKIKSILISYITTVYNPLPHWFHRFFLLKGFGYNFDNTTWSTVTDDKSRIQVIIDHWDEYDGHTYRTLSSCSFDTTNDYLLSQATKVHEDFEHPEHNFSEFRDFEWSKIHSYNFISSWKRTTYRGVYPNQEEAVGANAEIRGSSEVTILEYDPKAEVNHSDFELEGLDLPANTRVKNIVTGEEYVIDVQ